MPPTMENSTVLVTGANGGLGVQFVLQALELGAAKVYATARRPRDWPDSRVVPLHLDVTDEGSVAAAARIAGDTTVVVNNAGISLIPDRLLTLPMADIRATFETNFFGALRVARAFAPIVSANGGGAFLHVHSALSWVVGDPQGPTGGHGAYAAAKAAFWSATNSLRLDLAAHRIHVMGLHMGYTDTPMAEAIDDPKSDPADIVRFAYEGLGAGEFEVAADDLSRTLKQALSAPVEVLYSQLTLPSTS